MKIIKTIQTKKEGLSFFKELENASFNNNINLLDNLIKIDSSKTFQTIKGFGGAFTEASAVAIENLSESKRQEVLNAYFSKDGLNYNLGRTTINSCDFALGNYTYVKENDMDLSSFDISHDKKQIIPLIHEAYKLTNNNLSLLASPWSPPAYMKDSKCMNYGGKLLKEFYPLWAKYFVKYIKAMKENNVNINMVSVQNEPAATQTWDSCIYSASEEKEFVKNHLGPLFEKEGLLNDVDIYVWDHNRGDILVNRAIEVFDDENAFKYIKGVAFHWYCSEDFESLSKFHNLYPSKELLFTEGCVEYGVYGDSSKLRWENGEHYAHHMINDFNNYSNGFIDWNLFLDVNGGPNHVKNFCEAPIMIDGQNIIYNAEYYYIGHFSKYVLRNAKRILTINACVNKNIESVSFLNPNGEIVVIVMNKDNENQETTMIIDNNKTNLTLSAKSITTFIVK